MILEFSFQIRRIHFLHATCMAFKCFLLLKRHVYKLIQKLLNKLDTVQLSVKEKSDSK